LPILQYWRQAFPTLQLFWRRPLKRFIGEQSLTFTPLKNNAYTEHMDMAKKNVSCLGGNPYWNHNHNTIFWLSAACFLLITAPATHSLQLHYHTTAVLGLIGLWRYSWMSLHWLRASIYFKHLFPKYRRMATLQPATLAPLYCIITSWRLPPETLKANVHSLLLSIFALERPCTLIFALSNEAEEQQVRLWWQQAGMPPQHRLWLFSQDGSGKRAALGRCLRAVRHDNPADAAEVALIDGDCLVPFDIWPRLNGFFKSHPAVGALTVHNNAHVTGGHP
jgi:mannuronan synthase